MPSRRPLPKPWRRYSNRPPDDGYRTPSLTTLYPISTDTMPASRNEIHAAAPATAAASPRSAKMPAPTIAPTPSRAAPRTVISRRGRRRGGGRRRRRCVAAEEEPHDQHADERGHDPDDLQRELERVVEDTPAEVRRPGRVGFGGGDLRAVRGEEEHAYHGGPERDHVPGA